MGQKGAPQVANTRVYQHHHLDSTRWAHVELRDDDIVVTTPYKCGTTWTQRILAALLHGSEAALDRDLSPWIDARFWGPIEPIVTALDAQPHRRFIKSHLALDGMVWDDRVRYVVVGRDPRDVFMSLVNHYGAYTEVALSALNDAANPGDPIPAYDGDIHGLWSRWIGQGWFDWESDGWPFWSAFHHLETWWTARDRPNVLLVHFADLLADPHVEIARLAGFLGLAPDDAELQAIVEVSSFDAMKRERVLLEAAQGGAEGSFFEGGAARFFHKGTNGRWQEVLTDEDLAAYEARMERVDPGLRRWLERGRQGVDRP